MIKKINLLAVDMGYGHQRAAYPLRDLSQGEIITINKYPGIPDWEEKYWSNSLKSYELISRFKKVPFLGPAIFSIMDHFQRIKPFYPFRDLSRQSWQQKIFLRSIKNGLGKDLIQKLNAQDSRPLVTTFFVAAYMAEYHNYQGDIYSVICDTDISRAWAPLWPAKSRTKFFAPNDRVKTRLLMYGVKEKNIFISGFPLPKENIGPERKILLSDLAARLKRLDPQKKEVEYYKSLLSEEQGDKHRSKESSFKEQSLTITFAVGGAGAQKEIGAGILKKLAGQIRNRSLNINLVAGSRPEIKNYFENEIKANNLETCSNVKIIFSLDKLEYFKKFNECLRTSDLLWTKPSELSFYCALGLPIIIATPVGSQEDFNREWLLSLGAGLEVEPLDYINEWWPNLINSGRLARVAVDGFLNAENLGTYKIEEFFE